jgi:DNA-binding CsgD family transcriptional regulator
MDNLDKELKQIEQGDAWNENDEVVEIEVRRPLDKVVPVRLSSGAWARLRREARELGVGPTTLARMWILERLRLHDISLQDTNKLSKLLLSIENTLQESPLSLLTQREAQILEYIAQGCPTKLISEKLGVSEGTIQNHIVSILRKIRARQELSKSAEIEHQQA